VASLFWLAASDASFTWPEAAVAIVAILAGALIFWCFLRWLG
jgi:ABC-type Fe3+-siderophore transport system permease subunit